MCLPCSCRQNTVVLTTARAKGTTRHVSEQSAYSEEYFSGRVRVYASDDHLVYLVFAKVAFQVGTATEARIPV